MRYRPSNLSGNLEDWVFNELQKIADSIDNIYSGGSEVMRRPPAKSREGMIVVADGVGWNPGGGKGAYEYRDGAWRKL